MNKMNIDMSHSVVGFKVKHMMISTVRGTFGTVMGSAEGELENMNINVAVDATTVDTNDENRDNHLRGTDFFDVENYPSIYFEAKGVNVTNNAITGELTIKGVTKEVTFSMDYNGKGVDPWGNTKHGFEISGKINRGDFGLVWNAPLEAGGFLVSDEVTLNIDIQATEELIED
jgi:polyisoprenoid-binding protein YceI